MTTTRRFQMPGIDPPARSTLEVVPLPEPVTGSLTIGGCLIMVLRRRRRGGAPSPG